MFEGNEAIITELVVSYVFYKRFPGYNDNDIILNNEMSLCNINKVLKNMSMLKFIFMNNNDTFYHSCLG